MQAAGKGVVVSSFGTLVERLLVNLTDPAPELGNARSTRAHPHPFLSDRAVRKALSMAIDRELLVEVGYGQAARPTCNVVPAPEFYASAANEDCLVQDIEGAKRLLDEAGWRPGPDGVRQEDGIRLSILYQTSTNAVRQDFQAPIKQWWSEIGVEVELRDIDASVFFGGDPGSPDTYEKFFADIEMYAKNFEGADPEPYLGGWRCGNEPRPASQWRGANVPRYCSEEYDRLLGAMAKTGDLGERARLLILDRRLQTLMRATKTGPPLRCARADQDPISTRRSPSQPRSRSEPRVPACARDGQYGAGPKRRSNRHGLQYGRQLPLQSPGQATAGLNRPQFAGGRLLHVMRPYLMC